MNLRPSGYEPDELPDCSIPRQFLSEPDFSCPENMKSGHEGPDCIVNRLLAAGHAPPGGGKCKEKTCLQDRFFLRIARFGGPGSDLLSHALRRSTIGARGLNDRVRNGIGWGTPAITTGSAETGNGANSNMSLMLMIEHVPLHFIRGVLI